jgi:glucosamine--fructose-6-phosphate aminotransferase (isomerizing)
MRLFQGAAFLARLPVFFGIHPNAAPKASIIFFPLAEATCQCGITGIVTLKKPAAPPPGPMLPPVEEMVDELKARFEKKEQGAPPAGLVNLDGQSPADAIYTAVRRLKRQFLFSSIYNDTEQQEALTSAHAKLRQIIDEEEGRLSLQMGRLSTEQAAAMSEQIERLKDAAWCLKTEVIDNIEKIRALEGNSPRTASQEAILSLKNINAVFNSIDRLEVRGRDSAGLSLLFALDGSSYERFLEHLDEEGLREGFDDRLEWDSLKNRSIAVNTNAPGPKGPLTAIAVTYKVAAEIGRLGDNISYIRQQVRNDPVFQVLVRLPNRFHTVSAHTRWASVGDINEANCHPVDNRTEGRPEPSAGIIHVCLNGDIDNYQAIKAGYAERGIRMPEEITCDTKVIPVHIQHYLSGGHDIETAFRLAVNDFDGSHAIAMHTDLAPGRFFLALKGSGQAIFVGLADDHYIPSSEIYGLVEETNQYLKLDGGREYTDEEGRVTSGQIFVLDQDSGGGIEGVRAMFYDGTPLSLTPGDIRQTPLTTRDIDRQHYTHYFLKEISESPTSVRKTMENRWKIIEDGGTHYILTLDSSIVPHSLVSAFKAHSIRRILFIGQGTAGVAAQACADIMRHYLNEPTIQVEALKSSELSGFIPEKNDLRDVLLIPISQSGTTTDTNRTVDMMKQSGAWAIGIVNRRDSDLTFKVNGVLYTSSGRDIEMSVASTKAFYSQIIAGAVLSLYITQITERRNDAFISNEIKQMLEIPGRMEEVLANTRRIQKSAERLAIQRTYWAAVGSGPNKAAADEIRIKLSELCYKTISSDFVEDKKHIDLSSEPLVFVCAAGTRQSVIGDIIKDTAIFRSHKALPVVICDAYEDRFDPYAADVLAVPSVSEHFAPIMNTLVGHIWGYYAALAINEGSRFFFDFRKELQATIDELTAENLDIFEIALEERLREKILRFYADFRKKQANNELPSPIGIRGATNLTLLLKYLSGRLPLTDFELDFGVKGTAKNMFEALFTSLGEAINCLARPVDAIKHQAKTVTVGTSRIEEKAEGLFFDLLADNGFTIAQLTISNIMVLRNLQKIIAGVSGMTLYRITGINLLGEPTDETRIEVVKKEGTSAAIASRSESDNTLKGTKRIIARQGNVYIGKGRKDDRSLLIIPFISTDPNRPNTIEHLMLLEVTFKEKVDLSTRVRALGGKYEHIKSLVQENNVQWEDEYLERVEMPELFGRSAEKVSEKILKEISSD